MRVAPTPAAPAPAGGAWISISTFACPTPGRRAQNCFRLRLDRLRNGRLVRGERHLHGDRVALDLDALDQTERDDIAAEAGILYGLQRFLDLFLGDRHGRLSYRPSRTSKQAPAKYVRR